MQAAPVWLQFTENEINLFNNNQLLQQFTTCQHDPLPPALMAAQL